MPKDGASDEDIIAFICAELKRDSDRAMQLIHIANKRAQAEGITLGSKKLPDGVDMNSLPTLMQKATQGADGQSQQAREYQNAFERDGGSTPKQVEEVSRLVDAVEKRGELSTQLSASITSPRRTTTETDARATGAAPVICFEGKEVA